MHSLFDKSNCRNLFASHFKKKFNFLIGKKVALYGLGEYTRWILQDCKDLDICALLDRTKNGSLYDIEIVSMECLKKKKVTDIIIVCSLNVSSIIYNRIKSYENIFKIWDLSGTLMNSKVYEDKSAVLNLNDKISMETDIYSFDFFDTLVFRKMIYPELIFYLVEKFGEIKHINIYDYLCVRQKVEKELYHSKKRYYSIDDIYERLQYRYDWSDTERDLLKNYEIEIEINNWKITKLVMQVRQLIEHGKMVIIVSDMYLPSHILYTFLKDYLPISQDNIYVSWEHKATKYEGNLYSIIQKQYLNKKILHIGDNKKVDVENAIEAHWQALYMPNILTQSKKIFSDSVAEMTKIDKIARALFLQRKYTLDNKISELKDYAYLFWAPVVLGYCAWLNKIAKENNFSTILLPARDGWLISQIIKKQKKINDVKYVYFYTSRKSSSIASIRNVDDIIFIIKVICENRASFTTSGILETAFNIKIDEDPFGNKCIADIGAEVICDWIINNYAEEIINIGKKNREHYFKYISKLDIDYQKVGLMNFVGRGATQKFLEKMMGRSIYGLYFANEIETPQILSDSNYFSWYFELLSSHYSSEGLARNYLYGEAILSSDEGSVLGFTSNGDPILENRNKDDIKAMLECHEGIWEYIDDLRKWNISVDEFNISSRSADELLKISESKEFEISNKCLNKLVFNDIYEPKRSGD